MWTTLHPVPCTLRRGDGVGQPVPCTLTPGVLLHALDAYAYVCMHVHTRPPVQVQPVPCTLTPGVMLHALDTPMARVSPSLPPHIARYVRQVSQASSGFVRLHARVCRSKLLGADLPDTQVSLA